MEASCNIVYQESVGSFLEASDVVLVKVRQWHGDGIDEYVATIITRIGNEESKRKELIEGNLARDVRRGIQIFDEERDKHPVLGKHE